MKEIQILVRPTGETTLETLGYQGTACQTASRFLEEALGVRQRAELTADYHQVPLVAPAATVTEPSPTRPQ